MNLSDKPEVAHAGAQLLHPGSRILFRHWETVRAERPCPYRTDIDLRAISKLMPWLAIIELGQNVNAPVFKLAGTSVCDLFQTQLTGTQVGADMDRFERRVVVSAKVLPYLSTATDYSFPEKFCTTSSRAKIGQNFSG